MVSWHRYSGAEFVQGAGILPIHNVSGMYFDDWYIDFKKRQLHLMARELVAVNKTYKAFMNSPSEERDIFLMTLEGEW